MFPPPILSNASVLRMKSAAASVLVLTSVLMPVVAEAAWPVWGYYGYGVPFAPPTDYAPRPPYYALYPPVYYSPLRTARPYGASPFAWHPAMPMRWTQPVPRAFAFAVPPATPQWIENPFVARKQAASSSKEAQHPNIELQVPAARQVAIIENPYVHAMNR